MTQSSEGNGSGPPSRQGGRAVLFFCFVLAALATPLAALAIALRSATPPFERVGPPLPQAPFEAGQLSRFFFPDGGEAESWALLTSFKPQASAQDVNESAGTGAFVAVFAEPYDAQLALEHLFASTTERTISWRRNAFFFTRGRGKMRDGKLIELIAWTEGSWLFAAEARNFEALRRYMESLPYVARRDEPPIVRLLHRNFRWVALGVVSWLILMFPLGVRIAGWAGTDRGLTTPVGRAQLEDRLSRVGDPGGPFSVRAEGAFMVVEWRIGEPESRVLLAATEQQALYRTRLMVDETRTRVLAQDEEALIEWGVDGAGSPVPKRFEWTPLTSVFFFDRPPETPLATVVGGEARFTGTPSDFDQAQMKAVLTAVVTQSGWSYRRVFSFRHRWLIG